MFLLGKHDAAIGHFRDMLRLNPGDNQGIRYKLLSCLIEKQNSEAVAYMAEFGAAWVDTSGALHWVKMVSGGGK